ncbi:threonine/serine exporter family protein [uncultured Merdimonas sp.]|uniref:threonine/serine exporter family protein n=1 Tax=uncultured Merdimonas sp. TaxID=2023269 RepID=UPI003208B4FB
MMGNAVANLICPFLGTVAFAVLFNVPRKYYLAGGLTGTAGWLAYISILHFASAAIASFVGAFVVVFISRMLTVRMKCPITVFLISGIFPLVPGAGVYYTAYYLVTDQIALAGERGLGALKIAFAIVLGIAFVVSIPREVFQGQYWRNRKTEKMRTGEKQ